jgi:hypothetical protein
MMITKPELEDSVTRILSTPMKMDMLRVIKMHMEAIEHMAIAIITMGMVILGATILGFMVIITTITVGTDHLIEDGM